MERDDVLLSIARIFCRSVVRFGNCFFFIRFAHRVGLLDHADSRKQHVGAFPLVGGLIFFSALGFSFSLMEGPEKLEAIIAGSLVVICVMGLLDDRFSLPVSFRLSIQICGNRRVRLSEVSGIDLRLHRRSECIEATEFRIIGKRFKWS